jgi:hypothetical protein
MLGRRHRAIFALFSPIAVIYVGCVCGKCPDIDENKIHKKSAAGLSYAQDLPSKGSKREDRNQVPGFAMQNPVETAGVLYSSYERHGSLRLHAGLGDNQSWN